MLWAVLMSTIFFLSRKKTHFKGWYLGVFVVCYMPVRFVFDFLRVKYNAQGEFVGDKRYLELTAGQWAAIVLFAVGIALLVRAKRKGDMLPPDGEPKYRPQGELEALARAESVGRPPAAAVGAKKRKR